MLENNLKKITLALTLCFNLVFSVVVLANTNTDEKIVKVAVSQDPGFDMIDNLDTTGETLIQAHTMIYEGLVAYGKQGKIEPLLAEKWEVTNEGKDYIFHLRKGVKFSDGSSLDAKAVKFSFERWVNDTKYSGFNIAKLLNNIEIIDDLTVKFSFKEKYYPLITEFTYPRPTRIMSPNSVSPAGDINAKFVKPIGTGKWIVDSFIKDQEAVLVANKNYWAGESKIDKIVLKVIPDPQTRILAIKNAEIDIEGGDISAVSVESLPSIVNDNNLNLLIGENTTSYLAIFNHQNPILEKL